MIITSILFTIGHALNPNMQILPVVNLFIGSLVFSLVYRYTGSLLLVGLGHGMWNFSQGFIFGAEVSGNAIDSSVFRSIPMQGKELISGGSFGFEGSVIVSAVGILMILWLLARIKKKEQQGF